MTKSKLQDPSHWYVRLYSTGTAQEYELKDYVANRAVAYTSPSTLYIAGYVNSVPNPEGLPAVAVVYKSTNYGVTWGSCVQCGGTDPHSLCVGDDDTLIVFVDGNHIYRSFDYGVTWTAATTVTGSVGLVGTLFRTSASTLLLANGPGGGNFTYISRSTDNGYTWTNIGIYGNSANWCVGHEFSETTTGRILLCTAGNSHWPSGPYGSIFYSDDDGLNWSGDGFVIDSDRTNCVSIDRIGTIIVANLYVWPGYSTTYGTWISSDDGITFTNVDDTPGIVRSLRSHSIIYRVIGTDLMASTDGTHWNVAVSSINGSTSECTKEAGTGDLFIAAGNTAYVIQLNI
jgi:hypothetical protein